MLSEKDKQETTASMPKNKSHSGAKKRFRVTGNGKIMRRQANRNHLLQHKPSSRKRRLDGQVEVSRSERKNVRRMINGTGGG